MIKGIGFRKIEISQQEYEYYLELVKKYGPESFNDLFETDDKGIITIIKPKNNMPWAVLFFIQNLMISQHLEQFHKRIEKIEIKLRSK